MLDPAKPMRLFCVAVLLTDDEGKATIINGCVLGQTGPQAIKNLVQMPENRDTVRALTVRCAQWHFISKEYIDFIVEALEMPPVLFDTLYEPKTWDENNALVAMQSRLDLYRMRAAMIDPDSGVWYPSASRPKDLPGDEWKNG